MSAAAQIPAPKLVSFARGTIGILKIWPALRIAIEGGWGGPESTQKRTWLASAIVDAFEEASDRNENTPDAIYIEEMLLQVLADEFDVVLEDGSAQPVATSIVNLWQEVMNEGRVDGVTRIEALVEQSRGKKVVVDEKNASDEECQWDDEEEDSGGEDQGPPQLLDHSRKSPHDGDPEVDEDGFTLVKSRRRL